jgi:hypothetical protein
VLRHSHIHTHPTRLFHNPLEIHFIHQTLTSFIPLSNLTQITLNHTSNFTLYSIYTNSQQSHLQANLGQIHLESYKNLQTSHKMELPFRQHTKLARFPCLSTFLLGSLTSSSKSFHINLDTNHFDFIWHLFLSHHQLGTNNLIDHIYTCITIPTWFKVLLAFKID